MTHTGARTGLAIADLTVDIPTPTGDVRVLRGLSLDIAPGEIVGIVGESGSGKSMTALSVLRLLPTGGRISGGSVCFDGEDLAELSPRGMRRVRGIKIGMIFQDPMTTLDPVVRVGDQIDEAYRIHHPGASAAQARERTLEVLASVGVPAARERALQYPHQWSGGMRQRAVIAMALVNEPDLIIADEPTTALDATVQAQVLEVLQRIQRDSGVAIAIITHDLGVIAQVASRVAVMYAGSVVEMASTEELFWDSRHPYTRALMDSRPAQSSRGEPLATIPGRPPAMAAVPEGCPFAARCTFAQKNDRCRSERPELSRSADGRLSACHFRDDTQKEASV